MVADEVLQGKRVGLRPVELDDCTETYLAWLQDPEVNRYLETRWSPQSIDTIRDFVTSVRASSHSYLFAIIYQGLHVGNIKIGPIHPIYKYADISYFVGERSSWGKGIASEAIALITDFAFRTLKLNRIQAGFFDQNRGSEKVLIKNGFVKEAVFRKQLFVDDPSQYCDHIFYGLLRDEYKGKSF